MGWVIAISLAWLAASIPCGIVLGRAIRIADEKENTADV